MGRWAAGCWVARPLACYVIRRNRYAISRSPMQNPFVYGEVVPGESFVDREAELDRLVKRKGFVEERVNTQ